MDDQQGVKPYGPLFHYYGDTVRRLFVTACVIMLVALPIFKDRLPLASFTIVIGVVVVGLAAGMTSPAHIWFMAFNILISLFGFITFESHAISIKKGIESPLFLVDQSLALIFFLALYYSTKTFRGFLQH